MVCDHKLRINIKEKLRKTCRKKISNEDFEYKKPLLQAIQVKTNHRNLQLKCVFGEEKTEYWG